MFDNLSDRLGGVFDKLKGRGALKEQDVRDAMREVRVALLEADVALPVARRFIDAVTEKAVGAEVLKSVTPGQQVISFSKVDFPLPLFPTIAVVSPFRKTICLILIEGFLPFVYQNFTFLR